MEFHFGEHTFEVVGNLLFISEDGDYTAINLRTIQYLKCEYDYGQTGYVLTINDGKIENSFSISSLESGREVLANQIGIMMSQIKDALR